MEYETLLKKANDLLNTIDKAKYPETFDTLDYLVNHDFYQTAEHAWPLLIVCDKNYPIEPGVAKLLNQILLDEIENGNGDAMCDLGALYYTGRLTGKIDYKKAVHYYEMAVKHGSRQATENLGYCYYYGRVGEPDYKKAYHCFVKGALDGHMISLYKVGDMYKKGLYVEKDENQAFYIYDHCRNMLNERQMDDFGADIYIRLADCYFYGIGTKKNLLEALKCYQQAETLYYPRICNGDFMYQKQYERAIAMQHTVREELKKDIPKHNW